MNYKLYLIGGLIYVVLAIILGLIGGMLPINLAPYAVLIAALIAGIYVGMKGATPMKAAIDGAIAGVIGGVIAGIVTAVMPIPTTTSTLLDSVIAVFANMITTYGGQVMAAFAWYIAAGVILGAVGGYIGKKIKK
jgi:uncharacterized membrane protein